MNTTTAPAPAASRPSLRLVRPETVRAHRMTWWVLVDPVERTWIRRAASHRGQWPGFDVECSCGWKSETGGAVKSYIDKIVWSHRHDAQLSADVAASRAARGAV